MSDQTQNQPTDPDSAPIEVSTLAVKVKGRTSHQSYAPPENTAELWGRLRKHVLTLAEMTVLVPVTVVVGAVNLVGGACSVFTRPPREDFEVEAEKVEGKRREESSKPQSNVVPDPSGPQEQTSEIEIALKSAQSLLDQFRERGLQVGFRKLPNGKVALIIVPPDEFNATEELLEHKSIPKLATQQSLDGDATSLDRSVAELDLTLQALGALHKLQISTVRQLVGLSAADLLEIDGFGELSLEAVRRELLTLGLHLDGD